MCVVEETHGLGESLKGRSWKTMQSKTSSVCGGDKPREDASGTKLKNVPQCLTILERDLLIGACTSSV